MGEWRKDLHRAVVDYLLKHGTPMDIDRTDRLYGYISHDWQAINKRVETHGIDYDKTTWEDAEWNEFKGTFYEGDTRETGIDLKGVLNDGSRVEFRWQGLPGDLIMAIAKGDGD